MSCQHGNWPPCDLCDEIDAAYEAGKKSALSQPAPQGVADKYAGMYMALADAMGYDSGKDGMEFSPEEFAAALVQERDALKADNRLLYSGQLDLVNRITEYEQERDALKARVAELEGDVARDAARYRWLREAPQEKAEVFFATDLNETGWGDWNSWKDKDAGIDAAISASKEAP